MQFGDMRLDRALTLWRPWGEAFRDLGKPVENRSWGPTLRQLRPGDLLALHNGQKWDKDGAEFIRRLTGVTIRPEDSVAGAITLVVRYCGHVDVEHAPQRILSTGWAFGPVCWLVDCVVPVEPLRCSGAQGLWTLNPDQRATLLRQWLAAQNGGGMPE